MSDISKKRIITAGLVGGFIFSLIVTVFGYFFGREFSWGRLVFYFVLGSLMYSLLTYRNFKKYNKNNRK